jgi:hypothetical protein
MINPPQSQSYVVDNTLITFVKYQQFCLSVKLDVVWLRQWHQIARDRFNSPLFFQFEVVL